MSTNTTTTLLLLCFAVVGLGASNVAVASDGAPADQAPTDQASRDGDVETLDVAPPAELDAEPNPEEAMRPECFLEYVHCVSGEYYNCFENYLACEEIV